MLLNLDDCLDELTLLPCQQRRLLFQLHRVCLHLLHRSFEFLEALSVARLDFDDIVLSLLNQALEDREGPQEEHRREVENMSMFLVVAL